MRWMRFVATWLAILTFGVAARAQTVTGRIVGTATDQATSQPVSDVTILVVGTRLGARSGSDGKFALASVPAGAHQLRATRVGYAPVTRAVTVVAGQDATADLRLEVTSVALTQVVVVGYGSQKRSDLTGSVSTVSPNTEQVPTISVEQALQGAAAGVQVTQASSAPGGGVSVRIRGGSSVTGNNEPLFVIDGLPIENDATAMNPSDGGRDPSVTVPSNPLAAIDPNDIESIQILKDASATAIYGARGANGVVIITTRQGKFGRPVFTLNSFTGTQTISHPYDLLGPREFAQFANAWSVANGTGVVYANTDTIKGTDWQAQIFRTAPVRSLQLGVTGGTSGASATRYALSGGTYQQDGIVLGTAFRRTSLRGNIDQMIGTRFHVTGGMTTSRVNSNSVPTDGSLNGGAGAVGAALQYFPTLPVRRADGTYTLQQPDVAAPLSANNVPNPVSLAADVRDQLGDTRFLGSTSAEAILNGGLRLRVTVGADLANRSRDTYYPRTTLQGSQVNGQAIRGTANATNLLNENTLNWSHSFGSAHLIDVLAGYSRQSNDVTTSGVRNSNFVSDIDNFESIGAGTQTGGPQVSSGHTRWTLVSYIGRLNYSLFDRYLFTLTSRRDGSSRFGADHRWGTFPSAALAWRVSDEPFMRRLTNIDQLKLRLSTGETGNPAIQPYQSLSHLNSQPYTLGGQTVPGYYPASVGNPNLSWETTRQSDVGIDYAMFGGRLSMTADAYWKKTSNLLLAVNLPFETGFTSALQNIGSVQNNGYEIAVTLNVVPLNSRRWGGLAWTTTFNFAQNKNRVLDLGGVTDIFASSVNSDLKLLGTLIRVGQPLGVFYGYKTRGIFRDSASAAAYTALVKPLSGQTWRAGDPILVDVAGPPRTGPDGRITTGPDGQITPEDRTIIGDPNPKWTGGWQNTLSYKAFTLLSSVDFVQGNKLLNLNLVRLDGGSPATNILRRRYEDAWSPTNPNGKYPRINFTPGTIGSDITSDLLEDGSFVRVRSITLEYALNPSWYRASGFSSARVYLTATNLLTLTKYTGFNPDVSSLGLGNVNRGIDVGAYPLARSITFGVNLAY